MINIEGISKRFGEHQVLDDITMEVEDGCVLGLVGYNGAGKTTLLKIIAGIYRPDSGSVHIDGVPMHDAHVNHGPLFIVADDPFFLPQATPASMCRFYRGYYPGWSDEVFGRLMELFHLDRNARISGFSKGMQRQLGILLGFSTSAKTLLLDESFDGLDLGKRKLIKRLIQRYAVQRNANLILASHNLRELEDTVDHLAMIKDSKLSFDGSLDQIRSQYPDSSLEEIFLEEGHYASENIDGIFDVS